MQINTRDRQWVCSRHAIFGYRYGGMLNGICLDMRHSPSEMGYSTGVWRTHQYYDVKCRRISQIFLSICRVGLIRSHRSDPCFKASVKQNGDAVSTLGDPMAAQSVSSSVVMRMLTAIFGLPCPIGLPNTSSNLWPLPAPSRQ